MSYKKEKQGKNKIKENKKKYTSDGRVVLCEFNLMKFLSLLWIILLICCVIFGIKTAITAINANKASLQSAEELIENTDITNKEYLEEENSSMETSEELIEDTDITSEEYLEEENSSITTSETADSTEVPSEEVGKYACISAVEITKTVTGVAPFDTESTPDTTVDGVSWTAGDDSSEKDNIVRSFDQITWTVENTFKLKETATEEHYYGGVIEITASVDESLADLVEWDLDLMNWAESAEVSSDGTTFTAKYSMTETAITIPGKQSLVLVLKVYGAPNKTKISPTFTLNLTGNDEEEKISKAADTVYVSAAPSYNIELKQNTSLQTRVTVDVDEEDTTGRMYGYGIILQLYNADSSKGLKGIEYPTGDITFDINLLLERTKENSNETEDITNECTPILWNYKVNQNTLTGEISGRTMALGSNSSYTKYHHSIPFGIESTNRLNSVYNSGNIIMEQEENVVKVTISNYDLDGEFPKYNSEYTSGASYTYGDNIGCFGAYYFQILVPDNEASLKEDRNYYLTVSDSGFKAVSDSGKETNSQVVNDDDSSTITHVIYHTGSYSDFIDFASVPEGVRK